MPPHTVRGDAWIGSKQILSAPGSMATKVHLSPDALSAQRDTDEIVLSITQVVVMSSSLLFNLPASESTEAIKWRHERARLPAVNAQGWVRGARVQESEENEKARSPARRRLSRLSAFVTSMATVSLRLSSPRAFFWYPNLPLAPSR